MPSSRPKPGLVNRGRGTRPWTPNLKRSAPDVLLIWTRPPTSSPYVTAIGSRSTSIAFTASKGRLIDEMPVAGFVTLKPSMNSGVSAPRAAPRVRRAARPRRRRAALDRIREVEGVDDEWRVGRARAAKVQKAVGPADDRRKQRQRLARLH